MKIIQVIHRFPPHSLGGSEVYTYTLSRELAKEHEVYVFHAINNPDSEEYEMSCGAYEGFQVCRINNTFKDCTSFRRTYKNDAIAKSFGDFLEKVQPDIVHFGHLIELSTTLIVEAKKRNIPVVFTLHDFWLFCQLGQLLKSDLSLCQGPTISECSKCLAPHLATSKGLRKLFHMVRRAVPNFQQRTRLRKILSVLYRHYAEIISLRNVNEHAHIQERAIHIKHICSLVDLFIAPSRFLLEKSVEFGIPRQKIIYCDYGFDMALFTNFAKAPSPKIRFGYIGTLIPSKGIHVLLQAFNSIENQNVELRIHGYFVPFHLGFEDYPDYLRSLCQKVNLHWCGKYENRDVAGLLSHIDVLVVPSIWYENSPLTIHEAFMAGIPVITSNIGGMAELISDGENGLHFQVGDPADLAKQMKKVLDDPGLIERLKENIRPVIPIEVHAMEIEKVYRGVMRRENVQFESCHDKEQSATYKEPLRVSSPALAIDSVQALT